MGERPLTLVVCGAPLAARAGEVVDALRERWSVSIVVTDAAGQWFSEPSEHDRPGPDLVVACPLSFNTANKVAAGSSTGCRCACAVISRVLAEGDPLVWQTRLREHVPGADGRCQVCSLGASQGRPHWPCRLHDVAASAAALVRDPARSAGEGDERPARDHRLLKLDGSG